MGQTFKAGNRISPEGAWARISKESIAPAKVGAFFKKARELLRWEDKLGLAGIVGMIYNHRVPKKTIIFLGMLLVLIELSGLPEEWKVYYGVFCGMCLLIVGFKGKNKGNVNSMESNKPSSFADSMAKSKFDFSGDLPTDKIN